RLGDRGKPATVGIAGDIRLHHLGIDTQRSARGPRLLGTGCIADLVDHHMAAPLCQLASRSGPHAG
ncbi:MAG: hypothetical protein ACKOZX_09380, partial [Gammaproteobacteria bacterium]